MIELLLQAERALSAGLTDQAARMYRQAVTADPRNSIAVVGLARVALERADDAEAYRMAQRALGIDPENVAARRLVDRLEEVYSHRGLPVPGTGAVTPPLPEPLPEPEPVPAVAPEPAAEPEPERAAEPEPERAAETEPEPAAEPEPDARPDPEPAAPPSAELAPAPPSMPSSPTAVAPRSLLDRLLRRNRP